MTIDWFTFTAQIVNLLVLVALLKRFLYRPVLSAMQKREDQIAASRAEVVHQRRQAEEQAESYRQKIEAIDRQRQEMLDEVQQEVDELRKKMLVDARETVDRRREDWMQTVEREKEALARQLRRRACKEVVATSRRTLQELAGVDLEESVIARFLERIDQLEEGPRREIQMAIRRHRDAVIVRTSFDVAPHLQDQIRESLGRSLSVAQNVIFHTSPDVVCGIELQASGNKVAWSVDEFLSSMEEELEREVI